MSEDIGSAAGLGGWIMRLPPHVEMAIDDAIRAVARHGRNDDYVEIALLPTNAELATPTFAHSYQSIRIPSMSSAKQISDIVVKHYDKDINEWLEKEYEL